MEEIRVPIKDITNLKYGDDFKNLEFECDVSFPHEDPNQAIGLPIAEPNAQRKQVVIQNCRFSSNSDVYLKNTEHNITFVDCEFYGRFDAEDSRLEGKVRFRNCLFDDDTNFRNTKFEELADFWRCTFTQAVIFYKTDFLGTTVFSAATFVRNVLFTYALIEKFIIFRGTHFKEGLDLSLAIIPGELSLFDIHLNNFISYDINKEISKELTTDKWELEYEKIYEKAVSKKGLIPIKNKLETFRIIKKQLKDEESPSSIDFNVLVKETIKELLNVNREIGRIERFFIRITNNLNAFISNLLNWFFSNEWADRVLLRLNKWSNNYGQSYWRGVLFTIVAGWLFFYPSIIFTSLFEFEWNPLKWSFGNGIKYFAQFLLPTHKFDYIEKDSNVLFYVFDFFGRIVVGYGIYQTIQAFRKFK